MDREQLKQIIDSPDEYDETKAETYGDYGRKFFNQTQPWAVALVFVHFFACLGLAIGCGFLFVITESTKFQIMWAAFFVCLMIIGYLIKVFGWIMGTRNDLKRDIKRLELRVVELSEALATGQA